MTKPTSEPPPRISARRFTAQLLTSAAAVVLGCGLVNAVVDPYGLTRWVDLQGFNAIKPRAAQAATAFKYRVVDFAAPRTLLLGNSRVEMGWDPDQLPAASFAPVVNLALPGQGLGAMVALADHAWARSRPTTLLVGVEFFDCLESAPTAPAVDATASPWAASAGGAKHRIDRFGAFAAQQLSLDSTADSLRTVLAQRDPDAPDLRRNGFQSARDYPHMQAIDGARKLFLQRDRENASARMKGPRSLRYGDGALSECFTALDRLLGDARARNQTVVLATYPYHARLLELMVNAGLWPGYEEWKALLTDRVAQHRQRGLRARLWDFGAYHRYAVEPIPEPGQRQPVPRWYWESGHFRSELGTRMVDRMLGDHAADGLFGVELTPEELARHLDEVRESRRRFAADQAPVAAEMATIARRACPLAAPADAPAAAERKCPAH